MVHILWVDYNNKYYKKNLISFSFCCCFTTNYFIIDIYLDNKMSNNRKIVLFLRWVGIFSVP